MLADDGSYLNLFLVNKQLSEPMALTLEGVDGTLEQWVTLSGFAPDLRNNAEKQPVAPRENLCVLLSELVLPPASWNLLCIKL